MSLVGLTVEQKAAAHLEGTRRMLRGSLYKTAKWLLGYSDMTHHTHDEMIEALESETDRKLIVMPRGTFKSSIGVIAYSIWRLIRNPNERILIDSQLYTNSKNFLREIKSHLQSDRFISLFGDWRSETNWNEGEITIAPRTETYKEASITAGAQGTTKVGQHYTVIIGDDMNSGDNSSTVEGCQKVIQHYRMNIAILEPGGTYVIIGTRYSANDLIGFILENEVHHAAHQGLLSESSQLEHPDREGSRQAAGSGRGDSAQQA